MSERTWKVAEILATTTDYLAKKDPSSPRLDAELLLSRVLKLNRVNLYVNFERVLTPQEIVSYRELVRRRGNHEPVAYILGHKEFYKLDLRVNASTLIPRPETEHLVDEALRLLRKGTKDEKKPIEGLDTIQTVFEEEEQKLPEDTYDDTFDENFDEIDDDVDNPAGLDNLAAKQTPPLAQAKPLPPEPPSASAKPLSPERPITPARPSAPANTLPPARPSAPANTLPQTRPSSPAKPLPPEEESQSPQPTLWAADIGTGSGAIALALLSAHRTLKVVASDISPEALNVAKQNALNHKLENRVNFVQGNLTEPFGDRRFDIVCANLPYIPDADLANLSPDVANFEPMLALKGGPQGLDLIAPLISSVKRILKDNGYLLLEIWPETLPQINELAQAAGLVPSSPILDYSKKARVFVAQNQVSN
jgi:release factor glutamine methyltransferase